MNEKTKAYLMLKKIKDHFIDHHYFTRADLEQFEQEEYQKETRRGIVELEGGSTNKLGGWNHEDIKP